MGRKRRLFTGAAREAALLMATRCDFSGCDVPGDHTQIDHLQEWDRDGGATDPDLAAGLGCGSHNRLEHRKHSTAKRHRTGHIIYDRPNGTPMLAVGRRHPDQLPQPTETDDQMLTRLARKRLAALRRAN